jgi:lysyl-tRNA synthetase class 1
MLTAHLGKPLTDVPDPFGTHEGFAQHNNARLRAFLDSSASSTNSCRRPTCYRSGAFDEMLIRALEKYR